MEWRQSGEGHGRRAVVCRNPESGCRCTRFPAHSARRKSAGRTALPARLAAMDFHLFHAARIGVEHFDLERARARHQFAAHRHAAGLGDEIAAERIDVLERFADIEARADHRDHFLELGARIGDERAVGLAHDARGRVVVMLVFDVADDLLDDVLDRDDAVGAAIFVDHEREMDARRLHLGEKIDRRHRWRHEQDRAHDLCVRQRHRQIDGAEIEPGDQRLLALVSWLWTAARAVMNAIRSRIWTMPTGSSSVSS